MKLISSLQVFVALQLGQLCLAGSKLNLRRRAQSGDYESSAQSVLQDPAQAVLQEPCLLLTQALFEDGVETLKVFCQLLGKDAAMYGTRMLSVPALTLDWEAENNVMSGETTLSAAGATIDIDGNVLHIPELFETNTPDQGDNRRRLSSTMGSKSVLVVRVKANDSQTSASKSTLSDKIFGTSGDPVNMASQYRACSNNKLRFNPASHPRASNGVVEVNINKNVRGMNQVQVEDWVTEQLQRDLGNNFGDQFDHVMYCLPAGVGGNWVGYAYINHYLSVFNNEWCERVSGQMHEVGHNLGLAHSGEGNGYDDQSGLMGFSYQADNTRMCFNGAKSWQLGWYSDKHSTARPLSSTWTGDLAGVADYGTSRSNGKTIILQIKGHSTYDYYATFNRKDDINSDTQEGANQVCIVRRQIGNGYAESTLVAKLNQGGTYQVNNFGSGRMEIKVTSLRTSSGIGGGPGATVTVRKF